MIAKTSKELGLLVRERRRALRLDQAELARRAQVSRQWIIEVEHGKATAEVGLVLRTLGVLGLTLDIAEDTPSRITRRDAPAPIDLDAIIERARGNGIGVDNITPARSARKTTNKSRKPKKARSK